MLLALSEHIREIDIYSSEVLGIPLLDLMNRSGKAVERVLREHVKVGSRVVILAGSGNNGGDGYALATGILDDYDCTVYDIFSCGQKTKEGQYYRDEYVLRRGKIKKFEFSSSELEEIKSADCIVDAVFGTGFVGDMPDKLDLLIAAVNSSTRAYKIAIDVPLGVNADDGSISHAYACSVNVTVALSFIKPGLVSYPARSFVGHIVYDDIELPLDELVKNFKFRFNYIDAPLAASLLPKRPENSNKGSFGKLLMMTGSSKYRGAAHLALEAALRGGVGLVTYCGISSLADELASKFPEAIYIQRETDEPTLSDIDQLSELSRQHTAVLVGSGSSVSDGLYNTVCRLLSDDGSPVILDADAINAMSDRRGEALEILKAARRRVVLTPHPLEFARLFGTDVASVQSRRIEMALSFAKEYNCILVLKGAGTVVTDGDSVFINSTGSSALSKAGSGDVLAGLIASVTASGTDPLSASALSVYFHGLAADSLKNELSVFGVTPSDLPKEIAKQMGKAQLP